MKNKLFYLFFMFFMLSSSLFAFENAIVNVNESGWLVVKDEAELVEFKLNLNKATDYEPFPGSKSRPPKIVITVRDNNCVFPSCDIETSKKLGEAFFNNRSSEMAVVDKRLLEVEQKYVKKNDSTTGKVGKKTRTFLHEIVFSPYCVTTHQFYTNKYIYTVHVMHYDGDGIENTKSYKSFMSSLEPVDSMPSLFSKYIKVMFVHPEDNIVGLIVFFVVIIIGLLILKKLL